MLVVKVVPVLFHEIVWGTLGHFEVSGLNVASKV
jgi:hypothetical protein